MNDLSKKRLLAILTTIGFGIIISFLIIKSPVSQTSEGEVMMVACEDISKYDDFNAENDLVSLMKIIKDHSNSPFYESNDLKNKAIARTTQLEEELKFHNNSLDYYRHNFAQILNDLAYAEMIDAVRYHEKENYSSVKESIGNAKHYLHDALFFLDDQPFRTEFEILHEINQLNTDQVRMEHLKRCMELFKQIDVAAD